MKSRTWVFLLLTLLSLNLVQLNARTYEPNPLKINITVDDNEEKTVQKVFSPQGGELTLKAYGHTYTLTVPEGALIGTPTIQMKAIKSARGIPTTGGFIAGVQITPEKIQFLKPVVLKVTGASKDFTKSAAQPLGFGVEQQGEEFHLRALKNSTDGPHKIQTQNLGGFGITQATGEEVQNIQSQFPPTDASDWFEQNSINADQIELKNTMLGLYNETLATIAAAVSNSFMMDLAFSQFSTWSIHFQSLPPDLKPQFVGKNVELIAQLANAFQTSVAMAKAKCFASDLYQLKQLLRWSALLLKHPMIMAQMSMTPGEVRQAALDCAQFEIEIESRIHDRDGEDFFGDTKVKGTIDIEPQFVSFGGFKLSGQGTLEYVKTEFNMGTDDCPIKVETQTGPSRVSQLSLGLDLETAGESTSAPVPFIRSLVRFSFLPSSQMKENITFECSYMPDVPMFHWQNGWHINNTDQSNTDPTSGLGAGSYIDGLLPGTGSLIGKRTYDREDTGFKEETTYKVIHTPGR